MGKHRGLVHTWSGDWILVEPEFVIACNFKYITDYTVFIISD
jgi:hypothetical protein